MGYRFSMLMLALFFFAFACNKEDDSSPIPVVEEEKIQVTAFSFAEFNPIVVGEIDQEALTILARVPADANTKFLTPSIEYTQGAEITPPPGYPYDFSQPLAFTLKKEGRSVKYTVTVEKQAATDNRLLSIAFPDLFLEGTIIGNTIDIEVPFGTKLEEVLIEMEASDKASITPASGSLVDLRSPLSIEVSSESGDTRTYTLTAKEGQQETGIRAFWVPAPVHSPFLRSYQGVKEGVALAKSLNFNTLYVCAWAQGQALYPSPTLAENSSYNTPEEALFWDYTGGSGDPLTDVIEEAHAQGIKVILWYEYGFMAKWSTEPTPANDRILAEHPDWASKSSTGTTANYNNTDYYYNAYHEGVQQFMIDFVMEAVNNYDIDGIQGDDRMPAMPRNSGYDAYTISKYQEEHNGASPPANYNNLQWVQWRADILNSFWKRLFDEVKAIKPNCLVTCSPNPYPWAFDNLMQQWPRWLAEGTVEVLSVQCYRYSLSAYQGTIDEVLGYFKNNGNGNLERLVPGLILYSASGLTDPQLVVQQIRANRARGISGESFFYDVPIQQNENMKKVFRALYPGEAIFPDL